MLKWRLISAGVIIAGLLGLLHLDYYYPLGAPGVWLLPLALVVAVAIVYELLDLWRDRADRPVAWPVYAGAPLIVLAAAAPLLWTLSGQAYPAHCVFGHLGWPLMAFVVATVVAFLGEMSRYAEPGRSTTAISLSVLCLAYAGLLLSFFVSLRLWNGQEWGMAALLSMVITVKLSDTGAYFAGRTWGKHKLAPVLSPGKTREGAVGGLAGACLGAWFCYAVLVPQLVAAPVARGPVWGWMLYGLVVAVSGMVGDLAESLLKRDAQRKDSSRWLPGLGGVMDVVDSLLFAAAPAYLCWAGGLIGPAAGN